MCDRRLVKNGNTSAGHTRWRCKDCGASSTQTRPDITRKAELSAFHTWLLHGRQPDQVSARTFRRSRSWCWNIEVPPPAPGKTATASSTDGEAETDKPPDATPGPYTHSGL